MFSAGKKIECSRRDANMSDGKFADFAATPDNANWEQLIKRPNELYTRKDDIRSPFARDYTRILHSMAYRRLKHKTQVFFNIDNDHICTRMEHVSHVESVSSTIANKLGLNSELTKAISMGHDLGHAPFGHRGEEIIRGITEEYLGKNFWHEQNGLRFVDKIELLKDDCDMQQNLNLTYAVRDGILAHCGEVDSNGLKPRDISIPIEEFDEPGKYEAVTWEGCVVKMADKIAYVGRDIEDAIMLGLLSEIDLNELRKMAKIHDQKTVNTTVITHNMIVDICQNSSPEEGIRLSENFHSQLKEIKAFNYEHIYGNSQLTPYLHYSELVIKQLFETLMALYDGEHTWDGLRAFRRFAPILVPSFETWLATYCATVIVPEGNLKHTSENCNNEKIYGQLETKDVYIQAIVDFISGMTDRFAITLFNELLQFGIRS